MIQRTKTDVAMDLLSYLGDVGLVNSASSAFTNEEFGKVEEAIAAAIKYPTRRFLAGKKVGCLPDKDAFCLLQAVELLMADEEAQFAPYDEAFTYKKIGRSTKNKAGYPDFQPDKNSRVPLTGLVWNSSRLNLSIRAKIAGEVELNAGYKKVGLEKMYPTFVWRNYTLVRDGVLNVQSLPVSLSKGLYETFLEKGLIDKEHPRHYTGRTYVVHLDRIPVINRSIAEAWTSATGLIRDCTNELILETEQKVLNSRIAELEPEKKMNLGLTAEQEMFLKENGVTGSGFNPPVEKEPATDFYMAKEFEVKAKGFSSLPKLAEVQDKIKAKKALNAPAELMSQAIVANKKMWCSVDKLKARLVEVRDDLTKTRSNIQKAKFSVVLANKWFEEFTNRVGCELSHTDKDTGLTFDYKFELGEAKVEI
jgi:hypothetical protein